MSKARVTKNAEKWHRLTVKGMMDDELVLMGRGRGLQLSIWCSKSHRADGFAFFTGEVTLKRLAREILKRS
jgi:hypothetical protein